MSGNSLQDDVALIGRIESIQPILDVICRSTGMGFAAVARVNDTHWVACAVQDNIEFGLKAGDELDLQTTICDEIRQHQQAVVIDHVAIDPVFCNHKTPLMYGFQSYISAPIFRRDGTFFGTLCAIDPAPAKLNDPRVTGMFKLYSELIGFHLDVQEQLRSSEVALLNERQGAELREQFIAVLGHDLRNPLASLAAGTHVLRRTMQDEKALQVLTRMDKSVLRMAGLIDNVLDFARGRLGGGFLLELDRDKLLGPELLQVVEELRAAWPEREINAHIDLPEPVPCQHSRMSQLLSNLVANALTHGAPDLPITVRAEIVSSTFVLSVENGGPPLSKALISRLFQPFFRAAAPSSQQGLGLGLFIVSEIARAHGGTMDISSTSDSTTFIFRLPM